VYVTSDLLLPHPTRIDTTMLSRTTTECDGLAYDQVSTVLRCDERNPSSVTTAKLVSDKAEIETTVKLVGAC